MGIFIKNSKFEKAEEVLMKHFPPKNIGKVRLLAKPFFSLHDNNIYIKVSV